MEFKVEVLEVMVYNLLNICFIKDFSVKFYVFMSILIWLKCENYLVFKMLYIIFKICKFLILLVIYYVYLWILRFLILFSNVIFYNMYVFF